MVLSQAEKLHPTDVVETQPQLLMLKLNSQIVVGLFKHGLIKNHCVQHMPNDDSRSQWKRVNFDLTQN